MILDLSCASSTRGPTVRGVRGLLTGAALAALLTACGGPAVEPAPDEGGTRSATAPADAAADAGAGTADPGATGSGEDGAVRAQKTGADEPGPEEEDAGRGDAAAAGKDTADARKAAAAVRLKTPVEVAASDLASSKPVAAGAPEVQPITAVFEAQESFVASERPAPQNPHASSADQGSAELDPAAVAAAEDTAAGAALQEVFASMTEFEHQGWKQRGVPAVVGRPVLAPLPAEGAEAARVTVCLDSSRVTVVDLDGQEVRGPQPDRRALHNYDLVRPPGGSWYVVRHGFPDDPTC